MENRGEIVIYRSRGGESVIDVKLEKDTIWLTQKQMADLFEAERSVIAKHIRNILATRELDRSTCAKFAQVQNEGTRTIQRNVLFYSLDMIISVGYRVNSKRGVQFRIWATNVLKNHVTRGLTVNEKRLKELEEKLTSHSDTLFTLYHNVNKMILNMPRKDVVNALADEVDTLKSELKKVLDHLNK